MSDRIFGEYVVYAGALQSGEEPAVAQVITKPRKEVGKIRVFTVISATSFATADQAMAAAHVVVGQIEKVSDDGVPYPLVFKG